jgi:hypothetical protein
MRYLASADSRDRTGALGPMQRCGWRDARRQSYGSTFRNADTRYAVVTPAFVPRFKARRAAG